jgi:hypothetical protein
MLPPWWGGLLLIAVVAAYELVLSWLAHAWPWPTHPPEADAPASAA